MMRPAFLKSAIALFLFIFLCTFIGKAKNVPGRSLGIAGLVIDAKTLMPVEMAKIYDTGGHLLGVTDNRGYYNVSVKVAPTGEIVFYLRIRKAGYQDIDQNDHWGNLSGDAKAMFFFGMKKKGDNTTSFSKLINRPSGTGLNYTIVNANFSEVKAGWLFTNKIEAAKAGNQDVLVLVNGAYYIVDESGWIKLNSSHDLVLINKKQIVPADKLNGMIKRTSVKMMTPITSSSAQFAIDTD